MIEKDVFSIFENKSSVKVFKKDNLGDLKPEFMIVDKFNDEHTRHEAIVPKDLEYQNMPPEYPAFNAKIYGFELDLFQKIGICALERGESVLVAAHTSSGKTVIAEYAIAMSIKKTQRVIYTSPIKALSNQKYRELQSEFKDVGLMTGDVTLNPEASCLVMTTEILRNMLYRGSEVLREVHWIVFDEIHYMRDKERGVVWEEAIILLPNHVRMVFLSATIPNASEFAGWVAKTHKQVIHVIYTEKRPTPLTHYVVPKGGNGLYKVKSYDEKTKRDVFDRVSFSKIVKHVGAINPRKKADECDIKDIINILVDKKCLPSIVFSFSRKECERFALMVDNDFLDDQEKDSVMEIFKNALSSLRDEDRDLPLIQNILPLLLRGVGIHHSGLLPILKEIVEILFQENFLKILFATETFSIGLNMPAKSVIFTALKKFDGVGRRIVSSGEYIQMSGRAGRRGIDSNGNVIVMLNDIITAREGLEVFGGQPDKLNSAFYLSYNMILNLMRLEGLDPLYLISRIFFHFQRLEERTNMEASLLAIKEKIQKKPEVCKEYFNLYKNRNELKKKRNKDFNRDYLKENHAGILKSGTLVDIFYTEDEIPYSIERVIINEFSDDELVGCFFVNGGIVKKKFPIDFIDKIYKGNFKADAKNIFKKLEPLEFKSPLNKDIRKLESELACSKEFIGFDRCVLCCEPSNSCSISCKFIEVFNRYICVKSEKDEQHTKGFFDKFFEPHRNSVIECFRLQKMKSIYEKKYNEYQKLMEVYHMNECHRMIKALKRLEYCDNNTILEKGKIACEISSGDELVLTEMIFNGVFSSMDVEYMVSLLSCFVFEEWQSEKVIISKDCMEKYEILKQTVEKISVVLNDCEIKVDPSEYVKKFSNELMDIVRMWVCGHTFLDICNKTSVFEGSIIRCFRRLEELLRQMCSASRAIGNGELENMFAIGITKIKRDIVFAGSLYL